MDCPNKNCKYYKKKIKASYFMRVDTPGGYCTKGYCESSSGRKESRCDMNEVEHFFDEEIRNATESIEEEDEKNLWCFNGVIVGKETARNLNKAHIIFCKRAKRALEGYITDRDNQISKMQKRIDCLKAELEEVQISRNTLPTEPIKVAEMLIFSTRRRDNCMTSKEYDKPVFEKWQLEQIAKHLLVYCNNSEDE